MLLAWDTAADADHQTYSDVGKAILHVRCYVGSGSCSIFTVRQDGDNDVVFSNFPQRVVVRIIWRHKERTSLPLKYGKISLLTPG